MPTHSQQLTLGLIVRNCTLIVHVCCFLLLVETFTSGCPHYCFNVFKWEGASLSLDPRQRTI